MQKLPLIVSDIDGVLIHQQHKIDGCTETIQAIQNKSKLPLMLLTNRSGQSEQSVQSHVNSICETEINLNQFILSHTPMRSIFPQYKDEIILVISKDKFQDGYDLTLNLMESLGVKKFITGREYIELYPEITPMNRIDKNLKYSQSENISKRIGIDKDEILKKPLNIAAIAIMEYPLDWEQNLQLCLDILSTENGEIADKIIKGNRKHVPVYQTFNDFTYKDPQFKLPRIMIGNFQLALIQMCKKIYDLDLEIEQYGKPQPLVFHYLEDQVKSQKVKFDYLENNNFEIGNKYMIGDNPHSDIQGANNTPGWISILVKTGVFQGHTENDLDHPGKYVVQDFKEAIKLIHKLENIPFEEI